MRNGEVIKGIQSIERRSRTLTGPRPEAVLLAAYSLELTAVFVLLSALGLWL